MMTPDVLQTIHDIINEIHGPPIFAEHPPSRH
jgi:hypothetical protein